MKLKLSVITFAFFLLFTGNLYAVSINGGDYQSYLNFAGNDSAATLNEAFAFGFNNWVFIQKQELSDGVLGDLETDYDYGLTVSADENSGTWSFDSDLWDDFSDAIIVLKASNGFTAFLLNMDVSDGTWSFQEHALSHLTVYARGGAPVPEPSTLLLLGAGIVGLVAYRRKKN